MIDANNKVPSDAPTRVAVIVVHGVADQKPGATADAFVQLMVGSDFADGARYTAIGRDDYALPVPPLSWKLPFAFGAQLGAEELKNLRHGAHATWRERDIGSAWRLSWRSDFQRERQDPGFEADRGLAYTQYLLMKALRNGSADDAYASQATQLVRDDGTRTQEIDVHEMYWADQSRLSSAIPRIVTEMFTMFFRLSCLGRDTVDEARRAAAGSADATASRGSQRGWNLLSWLQTLIDWSFTNVLAQLFFHLLLVGLFLVVVGLVGPKTGAAGEAAGDPNEMLRCGIAIGVTLLGLLAAAYFRVPKEQPSRGLVVAALAVGALGVAILFSPAWSLGLGTLALLSVIYLAVLRAADDRFPFVAWSGGFGWAAIVIAAVLWVTFHPDATADSGWQLMRRGGLTAFEFVLVSIKWWWIVMAGVILPWAVLSVVLGTIAWRRRQYEPGGSAATGRLGAVLSMASFLVIAMALWAALGSTLQLALKGHLHDPAVWKVEEPISLYAPARAAAAPASQASGNDCVAPSAEGIRPAVQFVDCHFRGSTETFALKAEMPTTGHAPAPAAAAPASQASGNDCVAPSAESIRPAVQFVDCRFRGSTETFSLLALLLLSVLVYLVLLVAPSIVAELQWATSEKPSAARRLGIWLTWFYRRVDRVILGATVLGIVILVGVLIVFVLGKGKSVLAGLTELANSHLHFGDFSQGMLHWFVIPTASIFAGLSAFGGVLSRNLPGIRAPLDAALDVDNHMREFPRRAIPRARIFARYAALLRKVHDGKYDRVVIVAHSQGTVISAEALRHLSTPHKDDDRRTQLQTLMGADVRLLTVGCPLRQLYAARFPVLYRWVLGESRHPNGPSADDLGVEVWANAFGAGDYVGRWLWSKAVDGKRRFHPLVDDVGDVPPPGRKFAYDVFDPPPSEAATRAALSGKREYETCIGYAAHTHYFDLPRRDGAPSVVAMLADGLIAGPPVPTETTR